MSDEKAIYVTKSGRISKQIKTSLNFSSRQNKNKLNSNTINMVLHHDNERLRPANNGNQGDNNAQNLEQLRQLTQQQRQQLEQQQQQLQVAEENQQEIELLRQRLNEQDGELQQFRAMQGALNQQQIDVGPLPQQLQQDVIQHQQVNVERQPDIVAEPRDYNAEICAIISNVTSMQIDIKMPEFHDENMSNPLELETLSVRVFG